MPVSGLVGRLLPYDERGLCEQRWRWVKAERSTCSDVDSHRQGLAVWLEGGSVKANCSTGAYGIGSRRYHRLTVIERNDHKIGQDVLLHQHWLICNQHHIHARAEQLPYGRGKLPLASGRLDDDSHSGDGTGVHKSLYRARRSARPMEHAHASNGEKVTQHGHFCCKGCGRWKRPVRWTEQSA